MMTGSSQRVQLPVWAALRCFANAGVYPDLSSIARKKEDCEEIVRALDTQSPAFAKESPVVRYSIVWLEFELKEGEQLLRSIQNPEESDAGPDQTPGKDGEGQPL